MAKIYDDTYGQISVRRHLKSRQVKLSVTPGGSLHVSAPLYTPLTFIRLFIKSSRREIQKMVNHHSNFYLENMTIGKSHRLVFIGGNSVSVTYKKPIITVETPVDTDIENYALQSEIKLLIIKALRNEAKAYLPRRIRYLADNFGFSYDKLRFSHAKSRWGSCSSEGVISLNIALMKLDDELIDYVILHELAHTREMNHSAQFWQLVANCDSDYKKHRQQLKENYPHI